METAAQTGLRIDDVLSLRTEELARTMQIREAKTGKTRKVRLTGPLLRKLRAIGDPAGYVWPHRTDRRRHRSRSTVYRDMAKAARAEGLVGVSPHSARKLYAVELYRKTGSLRRVQRDLCHDNLEVTLLYALADQLGNE